MDCCFSPSCCRRGPDSSPAGPRLLPRCHFPPLHELFDFVGVGVVGVGLDGRLTYANPSAERILGYHAEELKEWATLEVLAPGEGVRLVAEMEKICGLDRPPAATPAGRMAAYMNCIAQPASQPGTHI